MTSRGVEGESGRGLDRFRASRLASNYGSTGVWCADGLLNWRTLVRRNTPLGDHDEAYRPSPSDR